MNWKKWRDFLAPWMGWVGGPLIVGVVLLFVKDWHDGKAVAAPPLAVRNFTGFVKSEEGQVVPNARVVLTVDEDAPQTGYSDSVGAYSFRVKQNAKVITIDVTAKGYGPVRRIAPTDQSGPYEIRLSKMVSMAPRPSKGRVKSEQATLPPSQPPPAAQAPPPIVQNCPGGICPNGPIYGNPQINNYGWQPPQPRQILQSAHDSVVTRLKGEPSRRVRFFVVNSSEEAVNFVKLLAQTFSDGGWAVVSRLEQSGPTNLNIDGRQVDTHRTQCAARDDAALASAKSAMETLGYPCETAPFPYPNDPPDLQADVFISISGQPHLM